MLAIVNNKAQSDHKHLALRPIESFGFPDRCKVVAKFLFLLTSTEKKKVR